MTNDEAIKDFEQQNKLLLGIRTTASQETYERNLVAIKALKAQRVGHWIKTPKAVMGEGYMWYCDKCEHQVYQDSSRDYPSENYCPNCGAKMTESESK